MRIAETADSVRIHGKPDAVCAAAVDLARQAAVDVGGESVGAHQAVHAEGDRLVTHVFAANVGTTIRGNPKRSPEKSRNDCVPGAPISRVVSTGITTRVVSTSDPSAAHTSSEHQIAFGMRCPP